MSELGITPSQAHYVLSKMLSDKKVTRRDVASYLAMMQKEIDELESRLEELRSMRKGGAGPQTRRSRKGSATASEKKTAKKPKKAKVTAEQRASRKLQGVYMSLLRQIPKSKRSQYQRLAKDKDRQAAVDAMKAALGA